MPSPSHSRVSPSTLNDSDGVTEPSMDALIAKEPPPRRSWGASEHKLIAAKQGWKCAGCAIMLPAAYECDHRVPLWDDGPDDYETNGQALCGSCHAAKTQRENIERRARLAAARHAAILAARARSPIAEDGNDAEDAIVNAEIVGSRKRKKRERAPRELPIADPLYVDPMLDNPFLKFCYTPDPNAIARPAFGVWSRR